MDPDMDPKVAIPDKCYSNRQRDEGPMGSVVIKSRKLP
jgi:hypothetical protein